MAERNYACDSLIDVYFGSRPSSYYNMTGESIFKTQLYQCMISQALEMKSNIETRRTKNELGITVWQFNEIWPTGGWGSIEYGSPVPGQVRGGRWKPLHYWYLRSIYSDVMSSCGDGGACFVKNDAPLPFDGHVDIHAVQFDTGASTQIDSLSFAGANRLPAGAGTSHFFSINISAVDVTRSLLVVTCRDSGEVRRFGARPTPALNLAAAHGGRLLASNEVLLAPPHKLVLPKATVTFSVAETPNVDNSIDIQLGTNATALYVTLTTLAEGRFSDNAFALRSATTVQFIPFGERPRPWSFTLLRSSLRVEHLQEALA